MKLINKTLALFLMIAIALWACDKREFEPIQATAPANIGGEFSIADDNSGTVTVVPTGQNVVLFKVSFGDQANEDPVEVTPGRSVSNAYAEGDYVMTIIGVGADGTEAETTRDIVIRFDPPENLNVDISTSNRTITVTPSADGATLFEVYFGNVDPEEPTTVMPGESGTHVYDAIGTYTVRVVARGAGAASIEITEEVEITESISLPVDFEASDVSFGLADFGNASTSLEDNPVMGGINTSAKAIRFFKPVGAEVWAGTTIELGEPIDFSTLINFKLKSLSPKVGAVIRLKVENATDPNIFFEVDATSTVADEWEELIFELTGIDQSQSYSKVVLFFDFGNVGDDSAYFFDDVEQTNDTQVQLALPIDFEDSRINYTFNDFGNAFTTVADNPDMSGLNTSNKVARTEKANGAEVWAGGFIELPNPIDFSVSTDFKARVWSPKSGAVVRLKVENSSDPNVFFELDATTTTSNTWEELIWDFSPIDQANSYHRVVMFFDFGNPGDGSVYYWDDVTLGGSDPVLALPVDFESATLNYTFNDFGNAFGSVVDNPDATGLNTSAKVGRMEKANGAEVWAGSFLELPNAIDFSAGTTFKVKVWSPKSGAAVRLKVENATDPNIFFELDATTTTSNAWEELTWDFSPIDQANSYHKVVLFFDFGNPGDGSVYFFDDIQLTN